MIWIGFTPFSSLFWRIFWYNILIACILLERFSNRWAKSPDMVKIKKEYGEIPLFLVTKEEFSLKENENPLIHKTTVISFYKRFLWFVGNVYNLYGLPVGFFFFFFFRF